VELAAFCALNGLGAMVPQLYGGSSEDRVFVELIAERVEQELANG